MRIAGFRVENGRFGMDRWIGPNREILFCSLPACLPVPCLVLVQRKNSQAGRQTGNRVKAGAFHQVDLGPTP